MAWAVSPAQAPEHTKEPTGAGAVRDLGVCHGTGSRGRSHRVSARGHAPRPADGFGSAHC